MLIYGTGGFAYGNVITKVRLANLGFTNFLHNDETEAGYAVGGGLEYVFAPGWSAKLEYQIGTGRISRFSQVHTVSL